ncbi:MAG: CADD family putative folate metabolism protein [Calditrichia bacterium]
MNKNNNEFIARLDATIATYSLLKHPFYQLWNMGELDKPTLVEYAKQYYAHVEAFPVYLSAVHSRCEDTSARQLILENLIEEEFGEENHPELWLRFAEGVGGTREAVKSATVLPETIQSVNTLKRLTCSDNFAEGIAALYAYESQVPEVARKKREGLKEFYGIEDDRTVSYFSVHEEADIEHSDAEREILLRYATDSSTEERLLNAAEESAKAMWMLLDGIYDNHVSESAKACLN